MRRHTARRYRARRRSPRPITAEPRAAVAASPRVPSGVMSAGRPDRPRPDVGPVPISAERPDPIGRAWLRNRWEELTYLHWPYDPAEVQALLPDGLAIDVIDGSAWVSLIPFRMTDAAPAGVPAIPWLSRFAETNVRTYVVDSAGHRAIWFLSLEADRLPIVAFARGLLGFPYVWSEMRLDAHGDRRRYETIRRRWPSSPSSRTVVEIEIGERIAEPSERDVFLSARWGTVARWRGRLRHHPVEHGSWRLHEATLHHLESDSLAAGGLTPPTEPPIVRWAEPVDARFAPPQRV